MRLDVQIAFRSKVLPHALRRKPHARFSFADLAGSFAAYLCEHPFQLAHPSLACVATNKRRKHIIRDAQHGFFQPVLFHLFGQQMPFGNLPLFIFKIARHLYDLHAVKERPRNRIRAVCSGDEHHLGKIVRHGQEVVLEGVVLRAVQHLEHRRSRIAPHIARELINLIKQQHRVHRTCLSHGLDNPAGHCANIGTAMAADLRFIMHTAQAHAHKIASKRAGDGFRNRSFSHARRPNET